VTKANKIFVFAFGNCEVLVEMNLVVAAWEFDKRRRKIAIRFVHLDWIDEGVLVIRKISKKARVSS